MADANVRNDKLLGGNLMDVNLAKLSDVRKYVEVRPWGRFEQFTHNQQSTVKILIVDPHRILSYQYHLHRDEFWKVIGGDGFVILDGERKSAGVGDEFFVPQGTKHRIVGGPLGLKVLEISFGNFDESDNIRLKDEYGRS